MRTADITRKTKETTVSVKLNLDGTGKAEISTGIGFLNHMLELLTFHSGWDLTVNAQGDLDVDDHHTVEDIGIVLGTAIKEAAGDRIGIARYGSFTCPMDESLVQIDLDYSNRPYLVFHGDFSREKVGELSTEMVPEFLRAVAFNAGITMHVNILYGENDHHKIEAIFKGLGHALSKSLTIVSDQLLSTKGVL